MKGFPQPLQAVTDFSGKKSDDSPGAERYRVREAGHLLSQAVSFSNGAVPFSGSHVSFSNGPVLFSDGRILFANDPVLVGNGRVSFAEYRVSLVESFYNQGAEQYPFIITEF